MTIGMSHGMTFEDEFHQEAAPWMIHPDETKDDNVVTPPQQRMNKQMDEAETNQFGPGMEVADRSFTPRFTPLNESDKKALAWDTPYLSGKDPMLHEGTPEERFNYLRGMLDVTDEEAKAQYEEAEKTYGKGHVIPNNPLPTGRIRGREGIPAMEEFLKNLPDDIDAHDLGDGSIVFRKNPKNIKDLVS